MSILKSVFGLVSLQTGCLIAAVIFMLRGIIIVCLSSVMLANVNGDLLKIGPSQFYSKATCEETIAIYDESTGTVINTQQNKKDEVSGLVVFLLFYGLFNIITSALLIFGTNYVHPLAQLPFIFLRLCDIVLLCIDVNDAVDSKMSSQICFYLFWTCVYSYITLTVISCFQEMRETSAADHPHHEIIASADHAETPTVIVTEDSAKNIKDSKYKKCSTHDESITVENSS